MKLNQTYDFEPCPNGKITPLKGKNPMHNSMPMLESAGRPRPFGIQFDRNLIAF
jgi:hypothetical protein